MKIYVASSWRNEQQPEVVEHLRALGHEVYDFRNPTDTDNGFHWSEIDVNWETWSPTAFIEGLNHPAADRGFEHDFNAMRWCDAMLLVMPCGRSAHLEIGWACGADKHTAILLSDGEPELMYKTVDALCPSLAEVDNWLASIAD